MTEPLSKIYFVHDGRAAYPEIAAYRSFFNDVLPSEEIGRDALAAREDLRSAICWHMMGFYPVRPQAGLVIHDYRSLSVGRGRWAKDKIKTFLNAKPDARIFQNEALCEAAGFQDGVPSFFLPMGVPESLLSFRLSPGENFCDFAYIGAMSAERRTAEMIDSFLHRFGSMKTFFLYGAPEPFLAARYKDFPNVVFKGSLPQSKLFPELKKARVAVNYFPNHEPHLRQTPTKLLEYAALGLRVLSNEQKQSRLTAEKYRIFCLWGPSHDMFRDVPDSLDWTGNATLDPAPFLWPAVIEASGVPAFLSERVRR